METNSLKCEKCGGHIELHSDKKSGRCINCDHKVVFENEEKTKFCVYCGANIHKDAVICPRCGRQVEEIVSICKPILSKKMILFLLCAFGGTLGLHKFYQRKIFLGILYLLTGGLFLIGWIVDLIMMVVKADEE